MSIHRNRQCGNDGRHTTLVAEQYCFRDLFEVGRDLAFLLCLLPELAGKVTFTVTLHGRPAFVDTERSRDIRLVDPVIGDNTQLAEALGYKGKDKKYGNESVQNTLQK
jgi:hypothetical protein